MNLSLHTVCCDKTSDNPINHLHKQAIRTVYNDNVSAFEKRLEKDNSATNHVRNLRILATELYKTKENLAAPLMHEIFGQRNIRYNLRSQTDFHLGSVKTVKCGLRELRYHGLKIWNIASLETKHLETLEQFEKIRNPKQYPCNLCQLYSHCLGYIILHVFFSGLYSPFLCFMYWIKVLIMNSNNK